MRAAFGGVYGLDFPSFLRFGEFRGIRPDFLADLLPPIESILLTAYSEGKDAAE